MNGCEQTQMFRMPMTKVQQLLCKQFLLKFEYYPQAINDAENRKEKGATISFLPLYEKHIIHANGKCL